MKRISTILTILTLVFGISACETYKVDEPEMSGVHNLDGQWICFAYLPGDLETPVSVFDVQITNTAKNESDRMWMTIADLSRHSSYYYIEAIRFAVGCDNEAMVFSTSGSNATAPETCHNPYLGQSYYTYGTASGDDSVYQVVIENGKVVKDGIDTYTGYKADSIEFEYTRTYPDSSVESYVVKGMKNTGWEEDMKDYSAMLDTF